MEAKLISDNEEVLAHQFPLAKVPLVIGRSVEAAIQVGDRWVSRHHCEISERDGSLVVRDLGSTHGTLLNGEPITESPLMPGDKLTVGLTTFWVSSDQRLLRSNVGQHSSAGSTILPDAHAAKKREIAEELSKQKPR